jgi:hypothetical protein
MKLTSTSDKVQVVTTSTANTDVYATWGDYDSAVSPATDRVTFGRLISKITTATTTDVVPVPGSGDVRKLHVLNISNVHGSTTQTVTVQITDGTNTAVIDSFPLLAGERWAWREGVGARIIDSNGLEKTTASPRTSGVANVAQIASHSADTYYVGLNVGGRVQAGSWFRWSFRPTKAAGTATPIYTIRYGTTGTVSDTARVTITGAAQTAVADEAWIVVEAAFRAVGASAVLVGQVHLFHRLATTGFSVTASNVFAVPVVSGTFDSSVANSIIGLSVNPGTAGAWVTDLVTLDAVNLLP